MLTEKGIDVRIGDIFEQKGGGLFRVVGYRWHPVFGKPDVRILFERQRGSEDRELFEVVGGLVAEAIKEGVWIRTDRKKQRKIPQKDDVRKPGESKSVQVADDRDEEKNDEENRELEGFAGELKPGPRNR